VNEESAAESNEDDSDEQSDDGSTMDAYDAPVTHRVMATTTVVPGRPRRVTA
jgi:hypothetical protein